MIAVSQYLWNGLAVFGGIVLILLALVGCWISGLLRFADQVNKSSAINPPGFDDEENAPRLTYSRPPYVAAERDRGAAHRVVGPSLYVPGEDSGDVLSEVLPIPADVLCWRHALLLLAAGDRRGAALHWKHHRPSTQKAA